MEEKVTLSGETMAMWVRIVDAGFDAMRKQIEHLQIERDDLEAELAELMDHIEFVPKQTWRPVSDPPPERMQCFVSDGIAVGTGERYGTAWPSTIVSKPKYWMPIPKLPEVEEL